MFKSPLSPLALSLALLFACQAAEAQTAATYDDQGSCDSADICFKKRWILVSANIGPLPRTIDPYFKKISYLIEHAKEFGYTGIVLSAKNYIALTLENPDSGHRYYRENLEALVTLAQSKGVEFIPMGAGPEVPTTNRAELVEAVPVERSKFKVAAGTARIIAEQSIATNGNFAEGDRNWSLSGGVPAGTPSPLTIDEKVGHETKPGENTKSVQFKATVGGTGNSRLIRYFYGLDPHTAYRISYWMKTENYKSNLRVETIDIDGKSTTYLNFSAIAGWGTKSDGSWNDAGNVPKETQGWTRYDLDINTLNYKGFRLNFIAPNGAKEDGFAWIDDIDIVKVGLPHTVVRGSLPVKVMSSDGQTSYLEGMDYKLEPEKLTIPAGSRIRDGEELRVSSFQSAVNFTSRYTTPASACSQLYFDEQKAVYDKVNTLFNKPARFFIYYDEWRVMNWDPLCNDARDGVYPASAYLANTTKKMQKTLLSVNPNLDMYVWNDMFDPNVNAIKQYWAVNGDLSGVLNNLENNITIMNWSERNQVESLKVFSDSKFRQMIALYYSDPSLNSTKAWLNNLQIAERDGVKGVDGFMYTTWHDIGDPKYPDDYLKLQDVTEEIRRNYPRYWPKAKSTTPAAQ
ncbi:hypothetical protein [Duganella sp. HH105]|uniref:hypothetical protein n=1 Tax=Duganella sp. HH105 TaxID=1781067 RepID=UPI000877B00D|nr:hypothetical protein [Duganella sp. HH105]OEZ57969.1 hypothetical protein DUGA6_42160 [Duganella sp. HH105]